MTYWGFIECASVRCSALKLGLYSVLGFNSSTLLGCEQDETLVIRVPLLVVEVMGNERLVFTRNQDDAISLAHCPDFREMRVDEVLGACARKLPEYVAS